MVERIWQRSWGDYLKYIKQKIRSDERQIGGALGGNCESLKRTQQKEAFFLLMKKCFVFYDWKQHARIKKGFQPMLFHNCSQLPPSCHPCVSLLIDIASLHHVHHVNHWKKIPSKINVVNNCKQYRNVSNVYLIDYMSNLLSLINQSCYFVLNNKLPQFFLLLRYESWENKFQSFFYRVEACHEKQQKTWDRFSCHSIDLHDANDTDQHSAHPRQVWSFTFFSLCALAEFWGRKCYFKKEGRHRRGRDEGR